MNNLFLAPFALLWLDRAPNVEEEVELGTCDMRMATGDVRVEEDVRNGIGWFEHPQARNQPEFAARRPTSFWLCCSRLGRHGSAVTDHVSMVSHTGHAVYLQWRCRP